MSETPQLVTFETLPKAISDLSKRLESIESAITEIHGFLEEAETEKRRKRICLQDAAKILGVAPATISRWRPITDIPVHEEPGQRPYCYEHEIREWAKFRKNRHRRLESRVPPHPENRIDLRVFRQ